MSYVKVPLIVVHVPRLSFHLSPSLPPFPVPPSAPAILNAVATSTFSITVEWAESTNDGGSPITGYVVEYREGSEPFVSINLDENSRGTTLTDLSPFTTYDVRVRTMNIVGFSDPSGTLTPQTHPDGMFRTSFF